MKYLETDSFNSAYNLAFEEYAFERLDPCENLLILWRNDRTVVVGRHQNAAAEVNADYIRSHDVRVVRRLSGGGAVYHDLGNLNFTFIREQENAGIDFAPFVGPVLRALARLGVRAELSGRNDLTIDGRKFSGNAQYARRGRVMHHGTLLFDTQLEALSEALRPSGEKLESKAVPSVRSRVTNIREHTDASLEDLRAALLAEIFPGGVERGALPPDAAGEIAALKENRYDAWSWTYGESPPYTQRFARRFPFGGLELLLDVRDGRIRAARFLGDFFGESDLSPLQDALAGARPVAEDAIKVLEGIDVGAYISGMTADDVAGLLR